MSFCMKCRNHASFVHTVFQGAAPVTLKLCDDCAAGIDAEGHLANIKGAADKEAKQAAVAALVAAASATDSDQAPRNHQPSA